MKLMFFLIKKRCVLSFRVNATKFFHRNYCVETNSALLKFSKLSFHEKSLVINNLFLKNNFNKDVSQYASSMCKTKADIFQNSICLLKKVIVVCIAGLMALKFIYFSKINAQTAVEIELGVEKSSTEIPNWKPIRKISSEVDDSGLQLTLYQHQTCPFCCKVRAYLDYKGFSYHVVEVNSLTRKEIKWSKYGKVPTLCVQTPNGLVELRDSAVIVSALETFLVDRTQTIQQISEYYPLMPAEQSGMFGRQRLDCRNKYFVMYGEKSASLSSEQLREERQWRQWADDVLLHTISPNVYRTLSEALAAFRWFSLHGDWDQVFSEWERLAIIYLGAPVMYLIAKRIKKKYALKPDVRESLYDACREWTRAVGTRKFMGGEKPGLADLAVYGVLASIQGCDAFSDVLQSTDIEPWFTLMRDATRRKLGNMQR